MLLPVVANPPIAARSASSGGVCRREVTVADEHGFHHGMLAVCPHDGLHAFPTRTVRKRDAQGRHIDHFDMRCSGCGYTWQPPAEELHLY
jgi:hypothetical protein